MTKYSSKCVLKAILVTFTFFQSCDDFKLKDSKTITEINNDNLFSVSSNTKTLGNLGNLVVNYECKLTNYDSIAVLSEFRFQKKFTLKAPIKTNSNPTFKLYSNSKSKISIVKFENNTRPICEIEIFYDSTLNCQFGFLRTFGSCPISGLLFEEDSRLFYLYKGRFNLHTLDAIGGIMELNENFEVISDLKIVYKKIMYLGKVNYVKSKLKTTSIYLPIENISIRDDMTFSNLLDTIAINEYFEYCGELLINSKSPQCYLPLW